MPSVIPSFSFPNPPQYSHMFWLHMTSPQSSLLVSLCWWFSELFENLPSRISRIPNYHPFPTKGLCRSSPILCPNNLIYHSKMNMQNVISKWKLLKNYPSNITKIMEMLANPFEEILDVCILFHSSSTSLLPRSPIFYWMMQSNRSKLA